MQSNCFDGLVKKNQIIFVYRRSGMFRVPSKRLAQTKGDISFTKAAPRIRTTGRAAYFSTGRATYFARQYSDCRLLPLRRILLQNMAFKLR